MTLNEMQRDALAILVPIVDASATGCVDPQQLEAPIAQGIKRGYTGRARMLLTQLGKKGAIAFRPFGGGFCVVVLPAGRAALAADPAARRRP